MANWELQLLDLADIEKELLKGCYKLSKMIDRNEMPLTINAQMNYLARKAREGKQIKKELKSYGKR